MKNLLIRLDDISPDMNWDQFNQVKAILDRFAIKPIIGVVPDNRDKTLSIMPVHEAFWDICRQLQQQGWTIAQHGFQHTYVTKDSGLLGINPFSEFAGLPFAEQRRKVGMGQRILHNHGIYAKMFMAPGHTYDKNTLRALQELGFEQVTDGYASEPYQYMGLTFLPCTLSNPRVTSAVDTICLHVNHMSEQEMAELERFCEKQIGLFTSVQELLAQDKAVRRRGMRIAFEEWKRLRIRKLRNFAATNRIVQEYFSRTDSGSASSKRRKRLLGLPGLLFHLLFHKDYR